MLNAFFQATGADPEEMHKELLAHRKSLKARIYDAQGNIMKIDQMDFGGNLRQRQTNICRFKEIAVLLMKKCMK